MVEPLAHATLVWYQGHWASVLLLFSSDLPNYAIVLPSNIAILGTRMLIMSILCQKCIVDCFLIHCFASSFVVPTTLDVPVECTIKAVSMYSILCCS